MYHSKQGKKEEMKEGREQWKEGRRKEEESKEGRIISGDDKNESAPMEDEWPPEPLISATTVAD